MCSSHGRPSAGLLAPIGPHTWSLCGAGNSPNISVLTSISQARVLLTDGCCVLCAEHLQEPLHGAGVDVGGLHTAVPEGQHTLLSRRELHHCRDRHCQTPGDTMPRAAPVRSPWLCGFTFGGRGSCSRSFLCELAHDLQNLRLPQQPVQGIHLLAPQGTEGAQFLQGTAKTDTSETELTTCCSKTPLKGELTAHPKSSIPSTSAPVLTSSKRLQLLR